MAHFSTELKLCKAVVKLKRQELERLPDEVEQGQPDYERYHAWQVCQCLGSREGKKSIAEEKVTRQVAASPDIKLASQ